MKRITSAMCADWIARAGVAPRLRVNHNIHEVLSDPVQRLFIAARPSSYFRPHRHPERSEFALILRGRFDVLTFDETGVVTERVTFEAGGENFGLEIPANIFHTWIAQEDDCVFFEVKQGPYDPETSVQFAPWAPEEGAQDVAAFQEKLLQIRERQSVAC